MKPERTCAVIAACGILHNLAIELNDMDVDIMNDFENDGEERNNDHFQEQNAFHFRDDFALNLMNKVH